MNKKHKSIYTLVAISPELHEDGKKWHYKTDFKNNFMCRIDEVGVFSSVKNAEDAIKRLIDIKNEENKSWKTWDTFVGFIVSERYIDDSFDKYGNIAYFESCRSYLSDGTLNTVSECDDRCNKKFYGTNHPNVHVKKGDIALVLRRDHLMPVLVENTAYTKDEWQTNGFKGGGDYTDDSGLVFSAYNGHDHPFSPDLFPLSCLPKAKISKECRTKMKEMRKGYFNGTML